MLEYYALYSYPLDWEKDRPPVGIVVVEHAHSPDWSTSVWHAIHWSHRQKAWVYDPDSSAGILSDEANEERQRLVGRDEAEQITPGITGGEPLPDEEVIRLIFHRKGRPPGAVPAG